jgi:hypothetical protein
MGKISSPAPTPDSVPAEPPTSAAKLTISLRPDQLSATAEGTVPAAQAHILITTFGVMAMGVAGIGGSVATLYVNPAHAFTLALAELAFALAGAGIIAACGHIRPRRKSVRGRAATRPPRRQSAPPPGPGPS